MITFTLIKANEDVDFSIPEVDVDENNTITSPDEEVDNVVENINSELFSKNIDSLHETQKILKVLGNIDVVDADTGAELEQMISQYINECSKLETLDEHCKQIIKNKIQFRTDLIKTTILLIGDTDLSLVRYVIDTYMKELIQLLSITGIGAYVLETLKEETLDIQKILDAEGIDLFA